MRYRVDIVAWPGQITCQKYAVCTQITRPTTLCDIMFCMFHHVVPHSGFCLSVTL